MQVNVDTTNEYSTPLRTQQTSATLSQTTPKIKSRSLNRIEWLIVLGGGLILLCLMAFNLYTQYRINTQKYEVQQYLTSISELEMNSEVMMSEIMEQYNYPTIKQAAEEANMSIDANRIKDVSHR